MSMLTGAKTGRRLPDMVGGKYRPVRVLGRGGMSVVYEVEHEFTKDRLALKVLNGSASVRDTMTLERFRREARVWSLVRNDHIVRVLDADIAAELNGAPFLVMDLLQGASLGALSRDGAQSPELVLGWLRQTARGLDGAHQQGIVHRDLKPENLFLAELPDGTASVKVLDFGVASIPSLDSVSGTATGAFVGTPLFMAPEQASGTDVGPGADIWSVAMCAFRLLSGQNYWEEQNVNLLLARIVYEPVVAPCERGLALGAEFDSWFLKSCARLPGERWTSVGVQIEALAAALGQPVLEVHVPVVPVLASNAPSTAGADGGGEGLSSHSLGATVTTSSDRDRRNGISVIAAFGCAVVAAVLLFRDGGRPDAEPASFATRHLPVTSVSAVPSAHAGVTSGMVLPQVERGAFPSTGHAALPQPSTSPSGGLSHPVTFPRRQGLETVPLAAASVTESAVKPSVAKGPDTQDQRKTDPLADPD